jgi:nucleotide-binding universal stress UspA family protein/predicted transcriptional regulator
VAEILAVIGEHERPLLVLSSHTRAGLDRLLFGSIAFELVRTAPCPVLVVRGTRPDAPPVASLAKVVAPLDQSPLAEHALDTALNALGPPDLRVHLLHIVEPLPHAAMAPSELVAMVEPKVQRHLQEISQPLLGRGYRVTTEVRHGKPDEEIANVAAEQNADLIVMAPHGQGRFHRGLLGSVAERVLRASPVPLLLVRPTHHRSSAGEGEEGLTAIPRPRETAETPPAPWERRARELMVQPVAVAREETPLANVAEAMLKDRLGCIPIVDEHGHLVGIVTESDFLGSDPRIPLSAYQVVRLFRERDSDEMIEQVYQDGRELTAGQIMSQPVVAVTEDEPVGSVAEVLLERGFNQVPVVREGVPVGIIARHDLLRLLIPPGSAARRTTSSSA